jgi:hypothetical protein
MAMASEDGSAKPRIVGIHKHTCPGKDEKDEMRTAVVMSDG